MMRSARFGIRTAAAAGLVLSAVLSVAAGVPLAGAQGAQNTDPVVSGPSAVTELGPDLPAAATRAGLSAGQMTETLRRDSTLKVDDSSLLSFYQEPERTSVPRSQSTPEAFGTSATMPYPSADTFKLHTRPSSPKKIFVDFNGHTTAGTPWNTYANVASFTSAPFDIDGSPSTFNSAERSMIQRIYLSMREDYAPFDVDITTEDPGVEALRKSSSTDTAFGVRVVATPSLPWDCRCGGIAYLTSFQWSTDTPAFVITGGVTGTTADTKYMAEVSAHEVGHTLGLQHDGLTDGTTYYAGHGSWAPIMGNSYNKPVTHFSKGEYANANNKEDDFAVMANNGVALRSDDVGDTNSTATALAANTAVFRRINRTATGTADKDVFRIDLATSKSVTIDVAQDGYGINPNLNLRLTVRNSAGTVVGSASPSPSMSAALATTLPAGTYYATVDGAGEGTALNGYTGYGSVGQYRIVMFA